MVTASVTRAADIIDSFELTLCAPFNGRTLAELLAQAEEKQTLAREAGLVEVCGLHAVYDVDADQWRGQLATTVQRNGVRSAR
jgi:hypothetical protein